MAKEGLVPRAAGTAAGNSGRPVRGASQGREAALQLPETERMRLQWSLGLLGTSPQASQI